MIFFAVVTKLSLDICVTHDFWRNCWAPERLGFSALDDKSLVTTMILNKKCQTERRTVPGRALSTSRSRAVHTMVFCCGTCRSTQKTTNQNVEMAFKGPTNENSANFSFVTSFFGKSLRPPTKRIPQSFLPLRVTLSRIDWNTSCLNAERKSNFFILQWWSQLQWCIFCSGLQKFVLVAVERDTALLSFLLDRQKKSHCYVYCSDISYNWIS